MGQLKELLNRLTLRQKLTILTAALLVLGGLLFAARWNRERDFRPLYKDVAAEDAGAVVNRLKEAGIEYRVSENGTTILVPSVRVAELRLQMAAAGLPKTGRIGFELFDGTNFGTTEFAEQVNYHRAIEGELERSVTSIAGVESARVHVTFAKDSVFAESRQPAKASVMVKLRPNAKLTNANVSAVTHLLASAVEGLLPEDVSVLDMQGNLLSKPKKDAELDSIEASDAALEFRRKVERDVLGKVHSTLEPLLGANKYRAGVSVECDFTSGEQSEEVFDPARSVMVSSQRSEETSGAAGSAGVPGTSSNLPRPALRPAGGAGSMVSRRTENTSYQSSRMTKRLRLPQGTVRKMSIAVVLDQGVRWEGTGSAAKRIFFPPSPERIKVIRDVVAGVVGFQAERGDQLIVDTQPFDSTLSVPAPPAPVTTRTAPPATTPLPPWLENATKKFGMPVVIGAGAGAVLLILALTAFVLLKKGRKKKVTVKVGRSVEGKEGARKELPPGQAEGGPNGPTFESQVEAKLAENAARIEQQEAAALSTLSVPAAATKKADVLKKHIAEQAKKDPVALAHVVRAWLNEQEER